MARIARVMFAGLPFHLTHRGNHKETVFFSEQDRAQYLQLLRRHAERFKMAVWAYCLMPNHVHLIAIGRCKASISRALGLTQQMHSRRVNLRRDVTGHLWANRFFSTALDEYHLWAAVRYVELNPVRAGIVKDATEYVWSSARFHGGLAEDDLLHSSSPFPGPIGDWAAWLRIGLDDATASRLRDNTFTGQPSGCDRFIEEIEERCGRKFRRPKRNWRTGKSIK